MERTLWQDSAGGGPTAHRCGSRFGTPPLPCKAERTPGGACAAHRIQSSQSTLPPDHPQRLDGRSPSGRPGRPRSTVPGCRMGISWSSLFGFLSCTIYHSTGPGYQAFSTRREYTLLSLTSAAFRVMYVTPWKFQEVNHGDPEPESYSRNQASGSLQEGGPPRAGGGQYRGKGAVSTLALRWPGVQESFLPGNGGDRKSLQWLDL